MSIDGHDIKPVDSVRNLGVILDCNLSMKKHVSNLCSSASFALRNIKSISKYLDRNKLERLVHAFISTKIDYCNSILYGLNNKEINKIQQIQNASARLITKSKKFDNISPILEQLHWLTVKKRIIYKVLLITFKSLLYQSLSYLTNILVPQQFCRSLRSESGRNLYVPIPKMKYYGCRAYSVIAPKLWNSVPKDIRMSGSVDIFKKELKTYLSELMKMPCG